jgi:hypothetical protein
MVEQLDVAKGFAKFPSRRSAVYSTEGIVACTQPLAAKCGIEILKSGGNAAVSYDDTPFLRLFVPFSVMYSNAKPKDAAVAVGR